MFNLAHYANFFQAKNTQNFSAKSNYRRRETLALNTLESATQCLRKVDYTVFYLLRVLLLLLLLILFLVALRYSRDILAPLCSCRTWSNHSRIFEIFNNSIFHCTFCSIIFTDFPKLIRCSRGIFFSASYHFQVIYFLDSSRLISGTIII